jgi:hypothetical protein
MLTELYIYGFRMIFRMNKGYLLQQIVVIV